MKKLMALVLVVACVLVLAWVSVLVRIETNNKKEKALMENGPWAKEAIWVDDNSQIYLICTKGSDDVYAKVLAFLLVDDQWTEYSFDLYQGAPIVSFSTAEGETVLEARAKMEGQKLHLYDFAAKNETFTQSYSDMKLFTDDTNEALQEALSGMTIDELNEFIHSMYLMNN